MVRSEPSANSTLGASPDRITLWFTEPMEARFSEIQVLNSAGSRVDNEDSTVDANDLDRDVRQPVRRCLTAHTLSHGTTCRPLTGIRYGERSSSP